MTAPAVLIVGASRGLGLGFVREYLRQGWQVTATVRDPAHDATLAALAPETSGTLTIGRLDINKPDEIAALRKLLDARRFDVVLVNAGVANDPEETIGAVTTEEFDRVMLTNVLSPLRFVETFSDLVKPDGVIAAMSSGMGSIANNNGGGWELYRASKAALNQLMKSFAARHGGDGTTYLVLSPGWVKTDMGGDAAPLDVETSVRGMMTAIAARRGEGGIAFVDYRNAVVAW
jgi:NAD(P)-dependent dehydrogenase (short-subunit alcohol dehydrogenase family)